VYANAKNPISRNTNPIGRLPVMALCERRADWFAAKIPARR
jgi:hypothetical protein